MGICRHFPYAWVMFCVKGACRLQRCRKNRYKTENKMDTKFTTARVPNHGGAITDGLVESLQLLGFVFFLLGLTACMSMHV